MDGQALKMGNYLVAYRLADKEQYAIENITTRQVIIVNRMMLEKFRHAIRENEPDSLFESGKLGEGLQAGGFILPQQTSELEIVRMEEMQNRFGHPEYMELWIAPTYNCNMACVYCGQHHVAEKGVMSEEVQEAIIKYLRSTFPGKKIASFCWYGGEPLLEPEIILKLGRQIKKLAEEHDVETWHRIITNGTLLNDSTVSILRELNILHAQVTVDTLPQHHNRLRVFKDGSPSWEIIMANIEKYCHDILVKVRVNLTARNHECLDEFLELLESRNLLERIDVSLAIASCFEGFDYVDLDGFAADQEIDYSLFEDTLIGFMNDKEMKEKLHAEKFRSVIIPTNFMQCAAKIPDSFVVGPRGELYKCALAFGDDQEIVGNILASDFPDKALESRYLGFDISQDSVCTDCLAYPACRGGCLVSRLKSQGLRNRCFISVPRWEKVLRIRLEQMIGARIPKLNPICLYPRDRRLGTVMIQSVADEVSC
ncbi:radical SAM protein [bacterium]|nr:radical SAM protein [bacterium]